MGQTRSRAGNVGLSDVRGPERYLHRYQGSQLVSIWGCLRFGNRESLWLCSMLEHSLFYLQRKKEYSQLFSARGEHCPGHHGKLDTNNSRWVIQISCGASWLQSGVPTHKPVDAWKAEICTISMHSESSVWIPTHKAFWIWIVDISIW